MVDVRLTLGVVCYIDVSTFFFIVLYVLTVIILEAICRCVPLNCIWFCT